MPVNAAASGRVPGSYRFQKLGAALEAINAESVRYQEMASTGVRIQVGSNDPAGAVRAGLMQKGIEANDALRTRLDTAESFLQATDVGLGAFADAATQARTRLQSGIGSQASPGEKNALAEEVAALRQSVILEANRTFNGRALFGGSGGSSGNGADGPPLVDLGGGRTLYTGDLGSVPGLIGEGSAIATAVDGHAALGLLTPAEARPLTPSLTDDTPLTALHGGAGVTPGELTVTLDDGAGNTAAGTVDLAGSRTVGDLRARLEDAFGAGPPGLSVGFSAAGGAGLTLAVTPAGGALASVTVEDAPDGRFGRDLGLVPNPAPATPGVLAGGPLAPRLTRFTPLAALNGGAGIDPSGGLRIVQGEEIAEIDLSAAATVGEALEAIDLQAKAAGVHVFAEVSEDGAGIALRGRVSGVDFSIGENGGTTAADLGVSTLPRSTRLADLPFEVPVGDGPLTVTRRDGTDVPVDLSSAETLDDVLAALNAVDPGVLTATLAPTGNGLALTDSQVPAPPATAGPLVVADTPLSRALGLNGTAAVGDSLIGKIDHPRRTGGLPDLLSRLETGLRAGDDAALFPLGDLLDDELGRVAGVRAANGTRQKRVAERIDRTEDETLQLRENLSAILDADLAEVFTRIQALQTSYEATLRLTAQANELSLVNFL